MIRKIIVLVGDTNSGKTTTLNLVYDLIVNSITFNIINPKVKIGANDKNDFETLFVWDNKKIAYFTMGDYEEHLINTINNYDNINVDILIIAFSRKITRASYVFDKLSNYNTIIIPKSNNTNHLFANNFDCLKIIQSI